MKLDFNSDETRLMKEALREFIIDNKELASTMLNYPDYYSDLKERVAAMQKDDFIMQNIVLKLRAGQAAYKESEKSAQRPDIPSTGIIDGI